jgi:hypothetical protein
MKTILLSLILLLFAIAGYSQKSKSDFVFTIKTDNPGFSNDSAYALKTDFNSTYNMDIDWDNDGIFDTSGVKSGFQHQYPIPGIYTIRIKGTYSTLPFGTLLPSQKFNYDCSKLIKVDQWGDNSWKKMEAMFSNCENLLSLPLDTPDLSQIRSLAYLFQFAESFNSPINHWDVSKVNQMSVLFFGAKNFDQDLDRWDVDSVFAMSYMFGYTDEFNGNISNWDTKNLWLSDGMFWNAHSFNQNLSKWSIDSLVLAKNMFDYSALSLAFYDSLLISWQAKSHRDSVQFGAAGLKYCLGDSARSLLIADGWSFVGDTLDCTTVGIEDSEIEDSGLKIYPNPSQSIFNFSISQLVNKERVEIRNVLGELIFTSRPQPGVNRIDLSGQTEGIYFLRYGKYQEKLILSR